MKRFSCLFFGLLFTIPVLSQGLAFGPDPLHLEAAHFVNNVSAVSRVRTVSVAVDWDFSDRMADLFPQGPTLIYQSQARPDRAILILNGRGQFPSQLLLVGQGTTHCVVTIPPGQGPGEMRNVGNAVFVNDHELVVLGDRKLIRVDVSTQQGRLLDTLPVARYVLGNPVRLGSVPDGVLILNDGLKPIGDRKAVPYYSVFRNTGKGLAFLHTGFLYMSQQRSIQRNARAARLRELEGKGDADFIVRMMCNRLCDGFAPFHYLVLDAFNRCLLAFNYETNRVESYTAFTKDRFEQINNVGGQKGLRLFYTEVHANPVDHTIWLTRNRTVDDRFRLVPIRKNGKVVPQNLPAVDVLTSDLHYKETIRFIPPREVTFFALQSIVITGAGEAYASAFVGSDRDGDAGGLPYELRLIRMSW